MSAEPYFELRDIRKHYALRRSFFQRFGGEARTVNAVDGVSFQVPQGSIFGLVGESGQRQIDSGANHGRGCLRPTPGN